MRKDYFSSFGGKTEQEVSAEWIFKSAQIISKLHGEVEDCYESWGGMTLEEIRDYLEKLPSWMEKQERGYAVGNFHCCMHLHAGPLHHQLVTGIKLPVDRTKEEEIDEYKYIYGGGFDFLDEEDIEFLRANGYDIVAGPKGPECRLA